LGALVRSVEPKVDLNAVRHVQSLITHHQHVIAYPRLLVMYIIIIIIIIIIYCNWVFTRW